MSWLDDLKKQVLEKLAQSAGAGAGTGTPAGADAPADPAAHAGMFDHALELLKGQGLANLMKLFEQKGLKDLIASWVSKGSNLPISVDQLKHVFGGETLQKIAAKLGLPVDQTAALLSKVLPDMVDHMTPDGTVTEPPAAEAGAEAGTSGPASF